MCGNIDMHIPLENLIPSHANCMQHVLRCWERQSDGTEYKKTLAAGAPPRTPLGSLQRSHKPTIWWEGLAAPLPSRPFGPRLSYPHSKISSDAVAPKSNAPNEWDDSWTTWHQPRELYATLGGCLMSPCASNSIQLYFNCEGLID